MTEKKTLEEIVFEGLGEASAVFMSQEYVPAGEIVMPTEELHRIGNCMIKEIAQHTAEVERDIEEIEISDEYEEMARELFDTAGEAYVEGYNTGIKLLKELLYKHQG